MQFQSKESVIQLTIAIHAFLYIRSEAANNNNDNKQSIIVIIHHISQYFSVNNRRAFNNLNENISNDNTNYMLHKKTQYTRTEAMMRVFPRSWTPLQLDHHHTMNSGTSTSSPSPQQNW